MCVGDGWGRLQGCHCQLFQLELLLATTWKWELSTIHLTMNSFMQEGAKVLVTLFYQIPIWEAAYLHDTYCCKQLTM